MSETNIQFIPEIADTLINTKALNIKNKLEKELGYFRAQYKLWIIDKSKLNEISKKIKEFFNNYKWEENNLEQKYKGLKQAFLEKTWLKLKENKEIIKVQLYCYDLFWIDKYTYKNWTKNRFIKWIIDSLIVDNIEFLHLIQEKWIWIIWDIIESICSWEWIKQIAKALWESVLDIFSWDAYEKWKSIIELWLVWTWTWWALKLTKLWLKRILKNNLNPIDDIVKKIEIWKKIDKVETTLLNKKIISNNPALWIFSQLKKGDKIQSIIFIWVKWVNDTFSQAFTDSILNNFKRNILKNYPGITPVWDDYKNFVLKIDDWAKIPPQNELDKMLNSAYKNEIWYLQKSELKEIITKSETIPKLKTISETWEIKWSSQKDIMFSLAEKRSTLEKKSLWNTILDTKELFLKIEEVSKKYNIKSNFKETVTDKRWRTTYTTKNGILYKEFTIKKTWKKITNRILILESNWNINSNIIKLVRKNKIPSELQVHKDISQIIKSSIANWEFIWPYIKKEWLKNWDLISSNFLNKYKIIKDKLNNWKKINVEEAEFLKEIAEKTYKNAFNKEIFYQKINKPWELFFLDIVWMWDINIQDFINKLWKYNSWLITKEKLLLDSWSYMTKKIQNILVWLSNDIEKLYPWKKINFYVGWDEIWIFIEWVKISNNKVIKIINKLLEKNLIDWRITKTLIIKEKLKKWWKYHLNELDKLTKYSKKIEERIDESIQKIKVKIKENLIHNPAELLSKLEVLKKFDLELKNWEINITFHPPDWLKLFEKWNTYKLKDIIDLKTWKLKPLQYSPFITYLKQHNLER